MYIEDNMVNENSGIKYKFDSNVGYASKQAIQGKFSDICSKAVKNQEFFDGLKVNVYGNWEDSYELKKISDGRMGFTKYPVSDNGKNIYLQTMEFDTRGSLVNGSIANLKLINESAVHELGHVFDYYFANPDKDITNELRKMFNIGNAYIDEHREEYCRLMEKYRTQNGLSDSDVFKEAWKTDVEKAFQGKSKSKISGKTLRLGYFAPNHSFDKYAKSKIKLEDGIDEHEILYADRAREEIFAQLFAYAMCAESDKKEKELIINTYPACYKIVQKYISEYLGINLTDETHTNLNVEV